MYFQLLLRSIFLLRKINTFNLKALNNTFCNQLGNIGNSSSFFYSGRPLALADIPHSQIRDSRFFAFTILAMGGSKGEPSRIDWFQLELTFVGSCQGDHGLVTSHSALSGFFRKFIHLAEDKRPLYKLEFASSRSESPPSSRQ